jgi:hypothetical protein
LIFFYELKLAALIAGIVAFISGLFSVGFMKRVLVRAKLEVNVTNKDPQKGLEWYAESIRDQISALNFYEAKSELNITYFRPRGLFKIFEPEIELEITTYCIQITASRLMVRLIKVDIEIE